MIFLAVLGFFVLIIGFLWWSQNSKDVVKKVEGWNEKLDKKLEEQQGKDE